MKVVILAAGKGSRLGDKDLPKPLTLLENGKSLLEFQLDNLKRYHLLDQVFLVVGFHKEMIMEAFPNQSFIYNPDFAKENTSKSLLRAMHKIDDDLLWLNGDVVFHHSILKQLLALEHNAMVVNRGPVGDEEVKYACDAAGKIIEVSKQVNQPIGEALGINLIKKKNLPLFQEGLSTCKANDYFEKGIELAIKKGMEIHPLVVDPQLCTEVDFPEDLLRANQLIQAWH
jgi:choline kinase